MTTPHNHNQSLAEMDRASILHPATAIALHLDTGPRIMADSRGVTVTDDQGKTLIDGVAGLWCVNIGYGRDAVVDAMARQARRLPYFHTFTSMSNEPQIRLADRLLRLAPKAADGERMSKVFFGNSGSDANDTQIKLVWFYNNLRGKPEKKKIISRKRAYHGTTIASGSLTGIPVYHKAFDLPLPFVVYTETPDPYWGPQAMPEGSDRSEAGYVAWLAAELEALILREGPETIGAMIAEPIMGAGGVIVPPKGYFQAIQPILKKYDILLIADEVICGFGRLGTMFGCEALGMEPDLISVAKGLTSGYFPMSACLISDKLWRVMRDASAEHGVFGHGFTYSGHPVGAAAALANLDIIETEGLVQNAGEVGQYMMNRIEQTFADHPLVGHIRGRGLLAGIELVADKANRTPFPPTRRVAAEIVKEAMAEGLIARALPGGDIVALSPPLTVTRADIDAILDRLVTAFGRVTKRVMDEGLVKAA